MSAVQVTTQRIGVSWRMSWAELGRSSLEYMLMRWMERKGGIVHWRVLRI